MNSNFEPPPRGLSLLATIGGIVTAAGIIAGLEFWSIHLHQQFSKPQSQLPCTLCSSHLKS